VPGVLPAVRELAARGVVLSIGHSVASSAVAGAAVVAGARLITHLFNAMPQLHTNASAEELPSLPTATQAGLDEALTYPRRGSLTAGAGAGSSEVAGAGAWPNAPVSRGKHVCGLRVRVRAGRVPVVALRARNRTEPWRARGA
jgi:hypothetical protein